MRIFIIFISAILIVSGCGDAKDGYWETVISDDFNRADGAPGSSWTVQKGSYALLGISENSVQYTSNYDDDTDDDEESYAGLIYPDNINNSQIKSSIKVMTEDNFDRIECIGYKFSIYPSGKTFFLVFSSEYFAIIDNNDVIYSSMSVTLLSNSTYYLKMEAHGSNLGVFIYDSNNVKKYEINTVIDNYSSVSLGFVFLGNGLLSTKVDDFEIMSYKELD